jgi:hypothetical protein
MLALNPWSANPFRQAISGIPQQKSLFMKTPCVPHVFVLPEVLVCLDCGFSELVIEGKDQLKVLAKDTITGGIKKMGTRSRALSKTSNPSQPNLSFGVQGRKNRTGEFYN